MRCIMDDMHDSEVSIDAARPRYPGLSGAAAAGLALGLTELAAGISTAVPSATASIGSIIVDSSPAWVKDTAISTLGTADKGALAIGTVIVVLLIGALTGILAVGRRWLVLVVFGLFAVLGVAVQLQQAGSVPAAVVLSTGVAAAAGAGVLLLLLRLGEAASGSPPEASPAREAPTDRDRRIFLGALVGVAGLALGTAIFGRRLILGRSEQLRASTVLPEPEVRVVALQPANSFDVPGLTPIVVKEPTFYRIDTALVVPVVDPETWRLKVTGMVDREVELTLDDLMAMPQVERYVTIACVSNEVGGGLVGNAVWQGVQLTRVLDQAGVRSGATQLVGRSVDGWTAGFPTEAAFDGRDPLIVIGMNGEPLPRRHGYPARLIVPGLYGYTSATKWLEEIELTTWDGFDAYWVPRGWSKYAPVKTQSRIDRPRSRDRLADGSVIAAGVAWAPNRGVARVEVQLDDGPWMDAEVSEPLAPEAWVQWKAALSASPGDHQLRVRATAGDGDRQPETPQRPRPDGATGWHTVKFKVE
jgi:DMSO/TMAO reductase YedYZ molybdopterin-dependent catalytic subunit